MSMSKKCESHERRPCSKYESSDEESCSSRECRYRARKPSRKEPPSQCGQWIESPPTTNYECDHKERCPPKKFDDFCCRKCEKSKKKSTVPECFEESCSSTESAISIFKPRNCGVSERKCKPSENNQIIFITIHS